MYCILYSHILYCICTNCYLYVQLSSCQFSKFEMSWVEYNRVDSSMYSAHDAFPTSGCEAGSPKGTKPGSNFTQQCSSHRQEQHQSVRDCHTLSSAGWRSGTAAEFWQQKITANCHSAIPLIAQDMTSAPAAQAFVERLSSVCGLLTVGRRNRMDKSMNMRAWLKVNCDELQDLLYDCSVVND